MPRPRVPVVSERVEQAHIVQLLTLLGGKVYVSGTVRRRGDFPGTMQSPGIPDLEVFLPPIDGKRRLLKIECKAIGGRVSDAQRAYQQLCEQADIAHVVGNYDAVVEWLVAHQYAKPESFPHYRQRVADTGART